MKLWSVYIWPRRRKEKHTISPLEDPCLATEFKCHVPNNNDARLYEFIPTFLIKWNMLQRMSWGGRHILYLFTFVKRYILEMLSIHKYDVVLLFVRCERRDHLQTDRHIQRIS